MKKYQQEIEELRKLLEQGTGSSDENESGDDLANDDDDNNAVVIINENGSPTKKAKRKATSEQELDEMKARDPCPHCKQTADYKSTNCCHLTTKNSCFSKM